MSFSSHKSQQLYYPISQFFHKRFGEKVYKVSVSTATTCPNRAVTPPTPCIFCDVWGSAAYHLERDLPLQRQIQINQQKIAQRYKAKKFLIYFQSYTNTFQSLTKLEKDLQIALNEKNVCGLILATRPDCLSEKVVHLLNRIQQQTYLMLEIGIQSFNDQDLQFLKRGYTSKDCQKAIDQIYQQTHLDLGIHLMFGLPGETLQDMQKTAIMINNLPVHNVKLHNLHVLRETELEKIYQQKTFLPFSLEKYSEHVIEFLQYLNPKIAIQRLTAVANRWDELIAPFWVKNRMQPSQFILNQMQEKGVYQGIKYK